METASRDVPSTLPRQAQPKPAYLKRCWKVFREAGVWALRWLGRCGKSAAGWLICTALPWTRHHFGSPALCFACNCFGVICTFQLTPLILWASLPASVVARLQSALLPASPLVQLPNPTPIPNGWLAVIILASAVFAGHHHTWRDTAATEGLLTRMILAARAGASWPWAWFGRQLRQLRHAVRRRTRRANGRRRSTRSSTKAQNGKPKGGSP